MTARKQIQKKRLPAERAYTKQQLEDEQAQAETLKKAPLKSEAKAEQDKAELLAEIDQALAQNYVQQGGE